MDKTGELELAKAHADATRLALRLDHGLTFDHDLGQRHLFQRQRQFSGLDLREIEDAIDQLQEIPPGKENLIDARLLRGRDRGGVDRHQLGKAEDRIER